MRGRSTQRVQIFVTINLEDLVPQEHPRRAIKRIVDDALSGMRRALITVIPRIFAHPSIAWM
jgi:hypothetical protein